MEHLDFVIWIIAWPYIFVNISWKTENARVIWRVISIILWIAIAILVW